MDDRVELLLGFYLSSVTSSSIVNGVMLTKLYLKIAKNCDKLKFTKSLSKDSKITLCYLIKWLAREYLIAIVNSIFIINGIKSIMIFSEYEEEAMKYYLDEVNVCIGIVNENEREISELLKKLLIDLKDLDYKIDEDLLKKDISKSDVKKFLKRYKLELIESKIEGKETFEIAKKISKKDLI